MSWSDATTETAAAFEHTLAEWRCRDCGTEFTIDGVLASTATTGALSCPICPAGEAHTQRVADHPRGEA
jgi:rubrerythrin